MSELSLSTSVEVSLGQWGWLEKPDWVKRRLKARFAQVPVKITLMKELILKRRKQLCIKGNRQKYV